MLGGSGSVSTGVATSGSPVPTLSSASGHAGGGVRNQPQVRLVVDGTSKDIILDMYFEVVP